MNKFRILSVFVVLAMVFSFANVSTADAATSTVTLQESTATISQPQDGLFVYEAVDGVTVGQDGNGLNGWATWNGSSTAQTAVWETASDVNASQLDFTLYHTWAASHSLGRFRLSYTTDDRSTFADGLTAGGDVTANWIVLSGATVSGTGGETFTELGDNSILVSGNRPATTIYSVSFSGNFSGVTGIRLEAIPDASLPQGGAGRGDNGNWHLVEITLDATTTPPQNLIVNGSFEDPQFPLGFQYTAPLSPWLPWPGSYTNNFSILRPDASDGEQYFGFATNGGKGSFYQAVSTVAGVQHTLSYDIKYYGRGSGPCVIASVYLASNLSNRIAGTHCDYAGANWRKITLTFTPTEADIVVRFQEGGSTRQRDPAIDNVELTIPNSPPVANAGGPYYGSEGFSIVLNGSASYDPDGNPLIYNWTVSDPGVCTFDDPTLANPNLTCIDNGDFPTEITVNDGIASDNDGTVVYVQNLPPEADLNNDGPIYEGDSASVSFSNASDYSSADTAAGFHYAFDCNGGSLATETYAGSGTSDSTSCAFADNGSFDVTGRIMDKDDGFDEWATTVEVNNVAPTLGTISVDMSLVPVNTAINASASFTDPGTLDIHAASWDWGDSASAGTVTQGAGSGSVNDSHSYSVPGVYTLKLTVTDNDSDVSNESIYQYVVVYDPSGGFVTGGGWIDSPAGAYKADESLSGKATFGFVAKYKKGATVPDGNTEFQFKAGDLNFKSTSYEWLVVAGSAAQFKGEGTINSEGSYSFRIWADDGATDTFRIQIWDANGIVYDNGAQQSLDGGSIKVHQ